MVRKKALNININATKGAWGIENVVQKFKVYLFAGSSSVGTLLRVMFGVRLLKDE